MTCKLQRTCYKFAGPIELRKSVFKSLLHNLLAIHSCGKLSAAIFHVQNVKELPRFIKFIYLWNTMQKRQVQQMANVR